MLKKLTHYLKKKFTQASKQCKRINVKKINTLLKKKSSRRQVNSARELHCSLFLSEQCNSLHGSHEQCTLYTVHVNFTVH